MIRCPAPPLSFDEYVNDIATVGETNPLLAQSCVELHVNRVLSSVEAGRLDVGLRMVRDAHDPAARASAHYSLSRILGQFGRRA